MENVLFKVSYPAEFHAQTAVEAAIQLHKRVAGRLEEIDRIVIETQESAMRIIDKTGPLNNPADRDHCIQYMTAIGLIQGNLTADDYEDSAASNPAIDRLREKMRVVENQHYSHDYLAPDSRSIANAVQIFFNDGTSTKRVEVVYPIGHRRRRQEAIPLLKEKFRHNIASRFNDQQAEDVLSLLDDPQRIDAMAADEFMAMLVVA